MRGERRTPEGAGRTDAASSPLLANPGTPLILYLNTDLDVVAADDLTALAAGLEALGVHALHVDRREDGLWYATFETDDSCEEPEHSIVLMLAAVASLDDSLRDAWRACAVR